MKITAAGVHRAHAFASAITELLPGCAPAAGRRKARPAPFFRLFIPPSNPYGGVLSHSPALKSPVTRKNKNYLYFLRIIFK